MIIGRLGVVLVPRAATGGRAGRPQGGAEGGGGDPDRGGRLEPKYAVSCRAQGS